MIDLVYSSTTQRFGQPVPISTLEDMGIDIADIEKNIEAILEAHDDFDYRVIEKEAIQ